MKRNWGWHFFSRDLFSVTSLGFGRVGGLRQALKRIPRPLRGLPANLRRRLGLPGLAARTGRPGANNLACNTKMTEPTFDADGYPTEATLRAIRKWDCTSAKARNEFREFVRKAWRYADTSWRQGNRYLRISTMGWSGNESLISAMQENFLFWSLTWVESKRGGHYTFEDRYR